MIWIYTVIHCCSHSTHSLVFWTLCHLSGALAKWMLCLQHVLVLSSGVCAQVRLSGSVLLPWQQRLGKCVCVFSVHVVPVLRTSWVFRDCVCARVFVRRDGERSSHILLLQSETYCLVWADKLARSPQSAIFFFFSFPSPYTLSHPHSFAFLPPPPFSPLLCALRTAGQGDSDEVHISVNQNVD